MEVPPWGISVYHGNGWQRIVSPQWVSWSASICRMNGGNDATHFEGLLGFQAHDDRDEVGPIDDEPTPERQDALRAGYARNRDIKRRFHDRVFAIRTRGELHWLMREMGWSGEIGDDWQERKVLLMGVDFKGIDLRGVHLYMAALADSSFNGANLRGAVLIGADLMSTNFSGAKLARAHLTGAYLPDAVIVSAELHGANLQHAVLAGANLRGADLRGGRPVRR